jgi:hypothetical protein
MFLRWRESIDRLAEAVEPLDDAGLERPVDWAGRSTTASALVGRMIFHNGAHCGQLIDLRRALGFPSVIR